MTESRDSFKAATHAFGLVALFTLVYGFAAPSVYVGGDAAAFAAAGASGGFAFPPGYPLFSMLLRLATWLPFDAPIHAFGVWTGFIGACAVGAAYAAMRFWRLPALHAGVAACLFGLSGHVLAVHSQPEVFALNDLLVALILGFCGPASPLRGRRRILALGALAGLALSHNHTCVLIAPVGLWAAWVGACEASETASGRARELALGALALALGLLPYLYLFAVPVLAPESWRWGDLAGASDLVDMFLRRHYGSSSLTLQRGDATPLDQNLFLVAEVARDLAYLPALVGVLGIVDALRVPVDGQDDRRFWLALLASLALCGPVFVSLVDVDPHQGLFYLLVRKFHVLTILVFCVFVARGWNATERFAKRELVALVSVVCVAAALALGVESFFVTRTDSVDGYLRDVAAQLPEGAIVLTQGDHMNAGMAYLQYGEGVRPDVASLPANLLSLDWFVERTNRRHGVHLTHQGTDIDVVLLVDELMASGRPVFMTTMLSPDLPTKRAVYPDGVLLRVLPQGVAPPPLAKVLEGMDARYASYRTVPVRDPDPRGWEHLIMNSYAAPWANLAETARRMGAGELARALDERAARWRAE